MRRSKGITPGEVYGRLTAVEIIGKDRFSNYIWHCNCSCGGTKDVCSPSLRTGMTRSCGCISRERPSHTKHGDRGKRIYLIWKSMRERCSTPSQVGYARYGGRGISVCKEWDDYATFREWAFTHGYDDTLTIERIDNDGNYEPLNCKWATRKEQGNNKRNNIFVSINNVKIPFLEFLNIFGVSHKLGYARYKRGDFPIPSNQLKNARIQEEGVK